MKYLITESGLKRILDSYFEDEFKDSVYETRDNAGEDWTGFWKNDVLLIGQPYDSEDDTWFFNGRHFDDAWKVFHIDGTEFASYMRDFLNKKYKGEVKIGKVY